MYYVVLIPTTKHKLNKKYLFETLFNISFSSTWIFLSRCNIIFVLVDFAIFSFQ